MENIDKRIDRSIAANERKNTIECIKAIMMYRATVITLVLVFSHFNGVKYLWLLLLLFTSFSYKDNK